MNYSKKEFERLFKDSYSMVSPSFENVDVLLRCVTSGEVNEG